MALGISVLPWCKARNRSSGKYLSFTKSQSVAQLLKSEAALNATIDY
jgi:hypothetical protein